MSIPDEVSIGENGVIRSVYRDNIPHHISDEQPAFLVQLSTGYSRAVDSDETMFGLLQIRVAPIGWDEEITIPPILFPLDTLPDLVTIFEDMQAMVDEAGGPEKVADYLFKRAVEKDETDEE